MAPKLPIPRLLLAPTFYTIPRAPTLSAALLLRRQRPATNPSFLPSSVSPQQQQPQPRRHFSSTPSNNFLSSLISSATEAPPPKTLTASRLLPYPASKTYTLIADINSYRLFLPHCTHSLVTAHTPPPQCLPSLGDLTVGYGPLTQSYTSRVYCIPSLGIVEAVSGDADTSIPADILRENGYDPEMNRQKTDGGIFSKLVTRWEVRPVNRAGKEWSDVSLKVTFQFANPALGFAAGHVADMKVDEMVEAFEGRARRLYGGFS
ncbi:dehydrase and lipid transport-domain-containing protein [Cladorrhinum sp. PSN259]|nr:dehydrase and lipid transport-domain-containing protein [Cladorrhinum sp. PSN259]